MNNLIHFTMWALLASFMVFMGLCAMNYAITLDGLKSGIILFGMGLYLLNLGFICKLQKKINDFDGGIE